VLDGKRICITGGTGSLGHALTKYILANYNPESIIVYSRDEHKHEAMAKDIPDRRVHHFIGDVRDRARLTRAFKKTDVVIHAAALKIVPLGEQEPIEFVKTNILGAINVIDAALDCRVSKVVALSTDKACNPINLYGSTKLCSDKLFLSANNYSTNAGPTFNVVRYGNVMGSRGSVIPLFRRQQSEGVVTITHPEMTRFMINMEQAIDLIIKALESSVGGHIYVPKIPSMNVATIAQAVAPDCKRKIVGIRPGEKMHEQMISEHDNYSDHGDHYRIHREANGITKTGFGFDSFHNTLMSVGELRKWLAVEYQ